MNLEYLAQTVWTDTDQSGETVAYPPDTLVGTDSHTTMVNGLAVLGWGGVGGIEAEAAMLGQPISMLIPEVVGFELTGEMMEGTTGTDLVLKVVEMLRAKGVVGKFVEFYGKGLDHLPLADRATIANMAPRIRRHLWLLPDRWRNPALHAHHRARRRPHRSGRSLCQGKRLLARRRLCPIYTDTLSLDMGTIVPAISGPKRPQDYTKLDHAAAAFLDVVNEYRGIDTEPEAADMAAEGPPRLRPPVRPAQIREGRGRGL